MILLYVLTFYPQYDEENDDKNDVKMMMFLGVLLDVNMLNMLPPLLNMMWKCDGKWWQNEMKIDDEW